LGGISILVSPLEPASFVESAAVADPGLAAGSAVLVRRPYPAAPAVAGLAEARPTGCRPAEQRSAAAIRWAEAHSAAADSHWAADCLA